ncbi:MAG TPA: hypothetical protein IGS53_17600 [Leptolyngbyaceae cyanobacterium M33_DOE_097]|uniref:Uncharacterized protein n=1 Tax=Oscillatoriales cyanobacterium SpSt-418 TaxID=2282169 RepID=A0A7C3PIM4_9CYAN|nr:hypothetical protein [Leptolyngbyaceae cyanobacterium M33_DOE_097]
MSELPSDVSLAKDSQSPVHNRTVLRLHRPFLSPSRSGVKFSAEALAAMRRLVGMVQRLRSPGGGWQSEATPTPENLVPYVSEEAYDLLDTLQAEKAAQLQPEAAITQEQHTFVFLETLTSQLLWAIARSSYPTMQLLEGIPATCSVEGDEWQEGMLRLVLVLEAQVIDPAWVLDLATLQPPPTLLPLSAHIKCAEPPLVDSSLDKPESVGDCVDQIQRRAQALTPALTPFFERSSADWLAPGKDWQAGELQLRLGLEFVPLLEPPASGLASLSLTSLPATPAALPEEPPKLLTAIAETMRLADPRLLAWYNQLALQQPFEQLLKQPRPCESDRLLPLAVAAAYDAADRIYGEAPLRLCFVQAESVGELLPRLLWTLTGSNHDIMALVGGITAQVMPAPQPWQSGVLRLAPLVELRTETGNFSLDLATRQAPSALVGTLRPWAIAQSAELPANIQLSDVATLLVALRQQVCLGAPELAYLFDGVSVEYQNSQTDWQTGTLYLHLSLEFFPIRG